VANALPQLKAVADVVAPGDDGEGVSWLIEQVLGDGLHRRLRQARARAD
jgi:hydroxymethylpyrimidine pyrophosphatase-like HAD family hydrolase